MLSICYCAMAAIMVTILIASSHQSNKSQRGIGTATDVLLALASLALKTETFIH